jgi:ubiquinone/menaquinone biosynthesis C-methylase UbiE
MTEAVLERALGLLACPHCRGTALRLEPSRCVCDVCRAAYPRLGEVFDFAPERGASHGQAQRVMENRWVAGIYEDHWRPWFTRLGSDLQYAQEERWLAERHAADSGGTALDLACGTGRYARWLARRSPAELVFGVDLSLPMLEQAVARAQRERLQNVIWLRADAGRLPLRDACVTAENCFGALHLFPDAERALCELGRVAVDGARLTCLTAQAPQQRPGRGGHLLRRAFSRLASFEFFDEARLQSALRAAGFERYEATHHGAVLLFGVRRVRG